LTLRLIADAAAQTTVPGAITAGATSIVAASTANFTVPQNFANGQISLTILDSGNAAWNPAAPLATPYEYVYCGNNNTGTNTFSGLTRGVAGTTAHSFFAGATIAQGLLAEDIMASVPWKFDEQIPGAVSSITIPASGSIPATYLGINWRAILIKFKVRTSSANGNDNLQIQFNGDSGGNYDYSQFGWSSTNPMTASNVANQTQAVVGTIAGGTSTAGRISNGWIEIFGYSDVTVHSYLAENYQSYGVGGWKYVGEWHGTAAAITSVKLLLSAGNYASSPSCLITTYLLP
jgi:hypothetical protein